jgi:DNA-directed RNA polymerase specialized sigma24 family protein
MLSLTPPRRPRRVPAARRDAIAALLARLTPSDRALLAMLFVEQLTPVEAAEVLGRSVRGIERSLRTLDAEMRSSLNGLVRASRAAARRKPADTRSRKAA